MSNTGRYNKPLTATLNGIRDLYKKKNHHIPLPEKIDLSGQKIMITGASSGLGFAATKRIAAAGAEIIMIMRSGIPDKGNLITQMSGNKDVSMYFVDLRDFESIKVLVNNLKKDNVHIDILISNAAMVPLKSRQTPQGLEEMFMVNYMAPFYLINQMINKGILNGKSSKIIIVSSESHRNPRGFDWDSFGQFRNYGINETVARYGYFKLLLTTFGLELSRRLNKGQYHISIRMLCPGPVNSNIAREAPVWLRLILKGIFSIFFRSPDKASDPILHFLHEDNQSLPVDYLFLMQRKSIDEKATVEENAEKLWNMSEELCEKLGFPLNG